jgi:hypothetical protein
MTLADKRRARQKFYWHFAKAARNIWSCQLLFDLQLGKGTKVFDRVDKSNIHGRKTSESYYRLLSCEELMRNCIWAISRSWKCKAGNYNQRLHPHPSDTKFCDHHLEAMRTGRREKARASGRRNLLRAICADKIDFPHATRCFIQNLDDYMLADVFSSRDGVWGLVTRWLHASHY